MEARSSSLDAPAAPAAPTDSASSAERATAALPLAWTATSYAPQSELRTVFIAGFPPDMQLRELHNLLKFLPGYEACQASGLGSRSRCSSSSSSSSGSPQLAPRAAAGRLHWPEASLLPYPCT
jgi:hypothetical protein